MWHFGYYIFFTNDYRWYGLYIIIYIQNMRFCARKPMGKWVNSNSVLLGPTSSFGQNKNRQVNSHDPLPTLQVKGHPLKFDHVSHLSPAIVISCKKNRVVFNGVFFNSLFKGLRLTAAPAEGALCSPRLAVCSPKLADVSRMLPQVGPMWALCWPYVRLC